VRPYLENTQHKTGLAECLAKCKPLNSKPQYGQKQKKSTPAIMFVHVPLENIPDDAGCLDNYLTLEKFRAKGDLEEKARSSQYFRL
jgi:hypothetical protein